MKSFEFVTFLLKFNPQLEIVVEDGLIKLVNLEQPEYPVTLNVKEGWYEVFIEGALTSTRFKLKWDMKKKVDPKDIPCASCKGVRGHYPGCPHEND